MANIGIERKQGTNTWVWVIVALAVVALLAWLLWPTGETTFQQQQGTQQQAPATQTTPGQNP
jgi:peptidoglycan/LPS O-acetylase OafA/YrhL